MKIGVINSIVTIAISIAELLLMAVVCDNFGIFWSIVAVLIPLTIHFVISLRFLTKEKRPWQFYLPSLAGGTVGIFVSAALCAVKGISHGDYDFAEYWGFWVSVCVVGYSIVYGALLLAIFGIKNAFAKRKERQ